VFPHMFFSLHPDYLMVHRLWPRSPTQTTIECDWYFDVDVMKQPDFDPSDAVDLWDLINRQDWSVCERTQKGTHSRSWKGGRFSAQESQVHDFEKYIAKRMKESGDATRGRRRPRRTRRRQGSRHRPGRIGFPGIAGLPASLCVSQDSVSHGATPAAAMTFDYDVKLGIGAPGPAVCER